MGAGPSAYGGLSQQRSMRVGTRRFAAVNTRAGTGRPRTLPGVAAAISMAATLVIATMLPTSTARADHCQYTSLGNGEYRVGYHCNTVRPLTAYVEYNSSRSKNYNQMWEGGSLPVGIYMQHRGDTLKFHQVNGNGLVYKSFLGTTAEALCWNRSSTTASSAECDYIYKS